MMRVSMMLMLVAASLMALAGTAAAHAKFSKAEPGPGSTLKVAPKTVRIWFSVSGTEELAPKLSAITVWDSRGRRVDDRKGSVDLTDMVRRSLITRLKPIGPGTYTVRWKAVSSEDKDVAQGSFKFTVAKP